MVNGSEMFELLHAFKSIFMIIFLRGNEKRVISLYVCKVCKAAIFNIWQGAFHYLVSKDRDYIQYPQDNSRILKTISLRRFLLKVYNGEEY
jgi:hypothetical protein